MTTSRNNISERISFLTNFIRHPLQIGSITPSSEALTNKLLSQVDFENAKTIVEYGPGTGIITEAIIKRKRPETVFLVLEINPHFITHLRQHLPQDSNTHYIQQSAQDLTTILQDHHIQQADYIVSGLPFSTIGKDLAYKIIQNTKHSLAPHGRFVAYQYSKYILKITKKYFSRVQLRWTPLNIPPAFIYSCTP